MTATFGFACTGAGCCASIQGVITAPGEGSIQNVGALPAYRRKGLGKALVLRSLHAFAAAGLRSACLEVTAENGDALRLYCQLGFRKMSVSYRAVES